MAHGLDIIADDYPARVARVGGWVLVDLWGLTPDLHGDPFPLVRDALQRAKAHAPVALVVRVRESRPPPAETREKVQATMRELGSDLAVVSIGLEGMGFRAIAFRSFVSTTRLLGIIKAPLVVSTSLEQALDVALSEASGSEVGEAVVRGFFEAGEGTRSTDV